jgi:hypothetical protein
LHACININTHVYIRDVYDFRFFPLLELPKFKINKKKFLCSSEVPIFGLQITQICNKKFFLTILLPTSDFFWVLQDTSLVYMLQTIYIVQSVYNTVLGSIYTYICMYRLAIAEKQLQMLSVYSLGSLNRDYSFWRSLHYFNFYWHLFFDPCYFL